MIKVIETNGTNSEGCARYKVSIEKDGKCIKGFSAHCLSECPEDAMLERDLNYVYAAVSFLKIGYAAGKSGEEIIFEEKKDNEDD